MTLAPGVVVRLTAPFAGLAAGTVGRFVRLSEGGCPIVAVEQRGNYLLPARQLVEAATGEPVRAPVRAPPPAARGVPVAATVGRDQEIVAMVARGMSQRAVGEHFGITGGRVNQIVRRAARATEAG